jgi:hypothetical protein
MFDLLMHVMEKNGLEGVVVAVLGALSVPVHCVEFFLQGHDPIVMSECFRCKPASWRVKFLA